MIQSKQGKFSLKINLNHVVRLGLGLLFLQSNVFAASNIVISRPKKQYVEYDSYFKTSRMNSLSTKIKKDEKPWGLGFHLGSKTDISTPQNDRTYDQTLSLSGVYKIREKDSIGIQSGLSYYSVDNTITKEEGNPKWDDLSVSYSGDLREIRKIKFSHSVSTFAPTSYDSQYEGIKSGLSYGISASHNIYFLNIGHNLSANYTWHTFDYSPTTGRLNSPWTNSYTLSLGAPYRVNKQFSLGVSENISNRSSFDNDYFLVTSTLLYGSWSFDKLKVSLNYVVGSYDENKTFRYFYVNEWEQKVSLGLSYDL